MRPVRLTMQAFGPYAGRDVVDFRAAVASGLFGVYGPTGSGKSTMFSAMAFALFGEPAKEGQEAKTLRSDHAPADLPTEVEFVFELGAKTYLVRRRPAQARPKLRGEGETSDPPEAWLFDATGVAPDGSGEDNPGKLIAEKKRGEVDRAIEDLLGYGQEQFRQIVLLPQGKFETFLAAKTPDRLAILRDLFDVSLYRDLADRLKAQAAEAVRDVGQKRDLCVLQLQEQGFESLDALSGGIETAAVDTAVRTEARETNKAEVDTARASLAEAQRLVGLFEAEAAARKAFAGLDKETAAIDALNVRVGAAEKARGARDLERRLEDEARELGSVREALAAARQASVAAVGHQAQTQAALSAAEAREGERQGLRLRLGDLERHRQKLATTAGLERAYDEVKTASRVAAGAASAAETGHKRLTAERARGAEVLKAAHAGERQRKAARDRVQAVQVQLARIDAVGAGETATDAARSDRDALKRDLDRVQARAAEAAEEHRRAEARLSRTQALILAEKLEAGEPCPVCGARDHPAPAHGEIVQSGLTEAFRDAEGARNRAQSAVAAAAAKLAAAEAVFGERRTAAAALPRADRPEAELRAEETEAETILKGLGDEVDIPALETGLDSLAGAISEAEVERDRARGAETLAAAELAQARAQHDAALTDIPEGLRDAAALGAEIEATRSRHDALGAAVQTAREAEKRARETALGAQKDEEAAATRAGEQTARQERAQQAFLGRLTEQGLDRARYQALKPAFATIAPDRERVKDHREHLAAARARRDDAATAVRELHRPELAPLREALEAAKARETEAVTQAAAAEAHHAQLLRLKATIETTYRDLEAREAETGSLRELAERFNGGNEMKLDLETFAIGAMFDRVLAAANLRLQPMTQGRYRLERALETGGRRGKRGLEIQAFDINTGKSRPTSTLSGGETFIAALALALGLADVVESVSGKVRMDTIFIDEGFGSLDTEGGAGTLDQVLQVLSSLTRNSRAIGLISHVSLVQDAIPNGFYIRHSPAGSHVEERAGH